MQADRCRPLLEAQLSHKILQLFRMWNPENKDSDGLALAKANQLAALVKEKRAQVIEMQVALEERRNEKRLLQNKQSLQLSESLGLVERSLSSSKSEKTDDDTQMAAEWLNTKCEFLLLKIRVMKSHIFSETFNEDTIAALTRIRHLIDEELERTSHDLETARHSLSIYQSVGGEFPSLVDAYAALTREIDAKRWALHELRSASDNKT